MCKENKIRHIAISPHGDLVALGEFENMVYVYNINKLRKVSEIKTILDFGGKRLAVSKKMLIAGSWYGGIVAYDIIKKSLLWQRKDLKKVQILKFNFKQDKIFALFNNESLQILDSKTGKTIEKIRNVINIYENPADSEILILKEKKISPNILKPYNVATYSLKRKEIISDVEDSYRGVLDLEFLPRGFVVSEVGGNLKIYLRRKLFLEYKPKKGTHILKIGYNQAMKNLYWIEWPYEKGGYKKLVEFDISKGEIKRTKILDKNSSTEEFALNSSILIISTGEIIDICSFKTKSYIDLK